MGSLRILHLQQNQLEFVDGQMLRGFEQLRSVDLSQNDLIVSGGGKMPWHSTVIDSQSQEVSEGALVGSIRLERIILTDNNLRHIWKDSFRDQVPVQLQLILISCQFHSFQLLIRLLDLSGNVLHSLEPGVFGQNNLLELDLSRNNFSAIPIRALDSGGQNGI
jgi:Leucine-rich repeat (LRR) protein